MRHDIKVVVADIDMTLRITGHSISQKNIEALKALHKEGVLLGLASGRPIWQGLCDYAKQWNLGFDFDFLIGLNGSGLQDCHTGKTEQFSYLTPEEIKDIILKMKEKFPDINPFLYRDDKKDMFGLKIDDMMLASAKRNHNDYIVANDISDLWSKPTAKLLFRSDNHNVTNTREEYARTFTSNTTYTAFRTTPDMLEFQHKDINKGIALERYCKANNIPMKDVWAFGDSENDLQMLEMAGHGICMKNGLDNVKAIADEITEYTCEEDGFGRFVFEHLL